MKNKFLAIFLMIVVLCTVALVLVPATAEQPKESAIAEGYNQQEALKARFANMLNRNFSYGEDIADIDALVNNSVLALLDKRDAENEVFIAEEFVIEYVYDMYGIEIVDLSKLNADMPSKDGFVYIIPRGYDIYTHEVTEIIENEDGTITALSTVTVNTHDNQINEFCAKTLFVKNENSCFGYNIVNSEIFENTISA